MTTPREGQPLTAEQVRAYTREIRATLTGWGRWESLVNSHELLRSALSQAQAERDEKHAALAESIFSDKVLQAALADSARLREALESLVESLGYPLNHDGLSRRKPTAHEALLADLARAALTATDPTQVKS